MLISLGEYSLAARLPTNIENISKVQEFYCEKLTQPCIDFSIVSEFLTWQHSMGQAMVLEVNLAFANYVYLKLLLMCMCV